MTNIYFIGGSPCSGKSTIAESLSKQYDLIYFKVDDYLDQYINQGAARNYKICKKQSEITPDQNWLREPALQCEEEIIFYNEVFEFILQDLKKLSGEKTVITEGASFMPHLMKKIHITNQNYISIIPTAEFQISHYKMREWIHFVLDGCTNKEKAFDHWMQRDILFADQVKEECVKEGFTNIVNDGKLSVEQLIYMISTHFGLK